MASIINLGLRAFQFFWTVLIIALVGNMIAEAKSGNPSIINYVMFTAVFSILSLFYLIVATIKEEFAIAPLFMLVADALNVLFFFCGGVALAAKLGAHSCGNSDYVKSNGVTNGADNMKKRCQEAQATTAFLWFAFAAYCGSLFFSFLATKGRQRRDRQLSAVEVGLPCHKFEISEFETSESTRKIDLSGHKPASCACVN